MRRAALALPLCRPLRCCLLALGLLALGLTTPPGVAEPRAGQGAAEPWEAEGAPKAEGAASEAPRSAAPGATGALAQRVVSMNPSLTAILLALGAGDVLVGVDAYSARAEPRVAGLPRVGGLADPDLEAVVALRPDLVVLVPSFEQRDFRVRLRELGVPVRAFDPKSFEEVLGTIRALGRAVGRPEAAAARLEAIRRARREVRAGVSERSRPRTVLVLQRDPLFVVGRGSFIDEMLRVAGAENLGAELDAPYPRVALEWLVAREPEVILDASAAGVPAAEYWSRLPSLPAVREGRVVALGPGVATLPGPWLDRALWELARAVHGPGLEAPPGAPAGVRGAESERRPAAGPGPRGAGPKASPGEGTAAGAGPVRGGGRGG